ncbi:MAG: hypothetical protein FXF47_10045 [Candidatus Mcinerneyibacterium aminivorans]|uniref:6-bladed beta-propeller n=1 Tax=Candidatus Mcinerneyibacterium aminivorans TaxID=2703815 RepID=A0A5D0MI67_9BACT|nr:MAG: hypothetical protein FXF47_10045 [Candidatus Mcinerneyibacterium aminivorans]
MKKYFLIVITFIIIVSCGIDEKVGKKSFEVEKVFVLNNYISHNHMGVYNKKIYNFVIKKSDLFALQFYNLNGKVDRELEFSAGKGPSDLPNSTYGNLIDIADDKIYFFCQTTNEIKVFDIDGNLIGVYKVDFPERKKLFDIDPSFFVKNESLYLHNYKGYYILKMDNRGKIGDYIFKNRSINTKKYDLKGGEIFVNKNNIFIGYRDQPYRIKKYDAKLSLINTYNKEVNFDDFEVKRKKKGNFYSEGHITVNSIYISNSKLYSSIGGGWKFDHNKWQTNITENYIDVWDIKNNNYKYRLWNKNLKNIAAGYDILSFKNDRIILVTNTDKKDITKDDSILKDLPYKRNYFVIIGKM